VRLNDLLWRLPVEELPGPLGRLAKKGLHLWVPGWLSDRVKALRQAAATPVTKGPRHLLFAVCDHYEPLHGNASLERGLERVATWRERYPELARRFRDANGRPPRHSYFFPGEQYDPRLVEPLGEMCELGLGEVEVHLHHDQDTRASLRASLLQALADLDRHGLVPEKNGRHAWAFIHGNWCLANGRRDGRWCGVDDEIELLHELGCYVDYTFPSAPDLCQPSIVNSIYYPTGDLRRRRAYEEGEAARVGTGRQDRLLFIQGPLALARRERELAVRIDGGAIDANDPPTLARLRTWVNQGVGVQGRPEWTFVKVHTHGAPEDNAEVMLGTSATDFHERLGAHYNDGKRWQLHYVTAREMYNCARAAMDGHAGSPALYFDYEIPPPPRAVAQSELRVA
jgi:hypothetical protein